MLPLVHLPVPRRLPTWAEAGIARVLALRSSGTHLSRLCPSVWSAALGSFPEAPVLGQTQLGHPQDPGLAWCVPGEGASSRVAVGVLMGAWCVAVASRDRSPPRTGASAGDSPRVLGKGTGRTPGQAEGGPVARKCGGPLGASTAPRAPYMDAEWSRPWVGGRQEDPQTWGQPPRRPRALVTCRGSCSDGRLDPGLKADLRPGCPGGSVLRDQETLRSGRQGKGQLRGAVTGLLSPAGGGESRF